MEDHAVDVESTATPETTPDVETTPLTPTKQKGLLARFGRKEKNGKGEPDETEEKEEAPKVPFLQLFRFTTPLEKGMLAIGSLAAIAHGGLLPLWTIVFGDTITAFSDPDTDLNELVNSVGSTAKWFLVLAAIAFILSFIQVRFLMRVAQRSASRIRRLYFDSLMRQEPEWYDAENSGELTTRVASDVSLIQGGIGDKVGAAFQYISSFVIGFIIALVYSWKISLVILATTPLIAACGAIFAKLTTATTEDGLGAYGGAGSIAAEAIGLIKTVTAFGGQEEEAARYEKELQTAYKAGVKKGILTGTGFGITMFFLFCTYSLAFWYGAKLIREGDISITDLFVAFFSVMIGAMSLGQAAPAFSAFSVAMGAAPRVYEIIDRKSAIDPLSDDGDQPSSVNGSLLFKNVTFNYKSREEADADPVLRGLDLELKAGTTHALVGPSGCGKSSTMSLLLRFYDPRSGQVSLDGNDLRSLNVRWLRSQMGYVGQMPTLFRATIRENIAFGAAIDLESSATKQEDVTEEQIIAAAKLANAHGFITKLPEGYDTLLGERGAMLSGGQKQRICIARAVVRDPKILLLDEATSALDAQSERSVQEALEQASKGRTTVIIAHRLSTVRNADTISVFKEGRIVEAGTHADLMSRPTSAYKDLVKLQEVKAEEARKISEAENEELAAGAGFDLQGAAKAAQSTSYDATKTAGDSLDAPDGEEGEKEEEPDVDKDVFVRAFKFNRDQAFFIVIGMFGAMLNGATWPVSALLFSEVTAVLSEPNNEDDVRRYALLYIAVGVAALVGSVLHHSALGISGEKLTLKMRSRAFRAMMRQEMAYFDQSENRPGALTTRLATEATLVRGITGDTFGAIGLAVATIGVGLIISFVGCWRVALVVLALLPGMVVGAAMDQKMMAGFDANVKKDYAEGGAIASEAVDNIRTVTGLGIQTRFKQLYEKSLERPLQVGKRSSLVTAIGFGIAEASIFGLWAVAFWVGSKFIEQGQCDFLGLMKGVTGLLFAGFSLGNVAMFMPDVAASKVAATKIFRLLDRQSSIDPESDSGDHIDGIEGRVAVKDAVFEYPSRPDVAVLRKLSLAVEPGKTLALVGKSGCGKSTVVGLLERFYDVREGSVSIDGKDVRGLEVQSGRASSGLVQQEPDLFNRTVRENIAYGLLRGQDGVPISDAQIHEAARAANCHDFVQDLPRGYDTVVGERGSALSGGQRQRVAIARSLVREPRILLLDEATSALDAKSEQVVQSALEDARQGRTTIVIAHRLSTVKDADMIAVVNKGKVAELGTHSELLALGGQYADLVRNQMTEDM